MPRKTKVEIDLEKSKKLQLRPQVVQQVNYVHNEAGKIAGLRQLFEIDPYNFDFTLFDTYFPEVFNNGGA